jgi:hypothetical protein
MDIKLLLLVLVMALVAVEAKSLQRRKVGAKSRKSKGAGFLKSKSDVVVPGHERTTTAKNMGILKYHPTSLKL